MTPSRKLATAITAAVALASTPAYAGDQFSFPSPSGALIASSTPSFGHDGPTLKIDNVALAPALDMSFVGANAPSFLQVGSGSFMDRYGVRGGDPYTYRLLTHTLGSASFANYAADYYRIFAPNYAVTAWTERVAGIVDVGYGGAVDGWTAGTYYLGRVRGPSRRKETAPDLSPMPKFHPHPELEQQPTFEKPGK